VFTGALLEQCAVPHRARREGYRSEERPRVDSLPYIRDVRQGPDGLIYLVTHTDDAVSTASNP
jgi:hypothetical protein